MRKSQRRAKGQVYDGIMLRGCLEYALRNAFTGEVVKTGRTTNAVVFKGRSWVLARLVNGSNNQFVSAMAFGSSSGNNDSSQVGLQAYANIKTIGTTAITTSNNSTPSMSFSVSFTNTETWSGSNQIREFGLYNSADSNGTLLARAITNADINFGTSNTLAVTYTISN